MYMTFLTAVSNVTLLQVTYYTLHGTLFQTLSYQQQATPVFE